MWTASGARRPQPPNEQLEFSVTAMDRRVCRLEEDSAKIWAKMEADKTEILLAGEARAEKLHNRINPIAEGMEGLKSAVELNNQQTVLLSAKLDRLMEAKKSMKSFIAGRRRCTRKTGDNDNNERRIQVGTRKTNNFVRMPRWTANKIASNKSADSTILSTKL